MSRRLYANKRGISPVVATVILVAVTIVVAVAVAYWMGGIAGLYTRYEKIEIVSAYAEASSGGWNITLTLKNTGSADATIDNVLVNARAFDLYADPLEVNNTKAGPLSYPLKVGQQVLLTIEIWSDGTSPDPWPFVSGVGVEVRVHTASGQEYPKTINLP